MPPKKPKKHQHRPPPGQQVTTIEVDVMLWREFKALCVMRGVQIKDQLTLMVKRELKEAKAA